VVSEKVFYIEQQQVESRKLEINSDKKTLIPVLLFPLWVLLYLNLEKITDLLTHVTQRNRKVLNFW